MLQTEFIRSMHSNYERILLDKKPEEKKYQYCILSRGGIKGLLPCSLRYMNGLAYLYYDITSRQSITQLFGKRCITREWLKDFMCSLSQIQLELGRFLLDERNVLWYPEQIFQDLENNIFSFLYIPYYEGENGFLKFLEYLVEHINYDDEVLVECVYKMYEQCEQNGEIYLQAQIFEDARLLDREKEPDPGPSAGVNEIAEASNDAEENRSAGEADSAEGESTRKRPPESARTEKRGIRYLLEGKKRRNRNTREQYQQEMQLAMSGYAVAEETVFEEEEFGQTVYIEETKNTEETIHRLYTPEGRIMAQLKNASCTIGKKREEADLILEDFSVSRIHAKIIRDGGEMYLEDLNSTNGTYKNGLRMQPYEKRKLEDGDEIKIGKVILIYH